MSEAPTARRRHRPAVALAFLAALAASAVTAGHADTEPVSPALLVAALVVTSFAAGVLLAQWRWIAYLLLPTAVVLGLGAGSFGNSLAGALAAVFATPLVVIVMVAGVAVAKLASPRFPTLTHLALLFGLVPLVVMAIQANRTVRADHTAGRVIADVRLGYRGVRLGDARRRAIATLGPPAAARRVPRQTGPTVGVPAVYHGLPPDARANLYEFLPYPYVAVAVRHGRVAATAAATSRGVGVGDSLSLVRAAYPRAACGEGDAGGDEPTPYPYCQLRADTAGWLTFYGDDTKPGKPVVAIWLTRAPLEGP